MPSPAAPLLPGSGVARPLTSCSANDVRIVPYRRTAHFIPSSSSSPSTFDPYFSLGLPRESLEALLRLAELRGEEAEAAVSARAATVADAYRTLAQDFHPDRAQGPGGRRRTGLGRRRGGEGVHPFAHLYSWIPLEDRFAAVASAASTLRDLHATLQWHAACSEDGSEVREGQEGTPQPDRHTAASSPSSSPPHTHTPTRSACTRS